MKGESFLAPHCAGPVVDASIANYGNFFRGSVAEGNCIDISAVKSLKAHNDGCGRSHPDFHFFNDAKCPGGSEGGFVIRKQGGGECFDKPEGAKSVLVVSN